MATIIQNILSINNKYEWQGYEFKMSDKSKNITCKISNSANCCERFGVYTNCNLSDFIGAEYQSVNITTRAKTDEYDYMRIVDVTIQTNLGEIVIILYNDHNGYYPHDFFTQTEYGIKIESL
jgi:hypothetical protein